MGSIYRSILMKSKPGALTLSKYFYSSNAANTEAVSIYKNPMAIKIALMTKDKIAQVLETYKPKLEDDWRKLTLEEKQALYILAYDVPTYKSKTHSRDVLIGVYLCIAATYVLFEFVAYFSPGPSPTSHPDHLKKMRQALKDKEKRRRENLKKYYLDENKSEE